jgi:transposase-like protein
MTLPAPTTLPEFNAQFPDEAACVEYLFLVRWGNGFVCPKCGDTHASVIKTRGLIECRNHHQTSVTAGTIMHRSKQPLRTWFYAAFLVSTLTPGISAVQFQKQLGLSRYETAFQLLHKLRAGLVDPEREPLKGEVEVDEAYVGGVEEGRPGRGAETKSLIVVGVEVIRYEVEIPPTSKFYTPGGDNVAEKMRAGRVRMTVIEHADSATLVPWCQKHIAPGSLVVTDGSSAYNPLTKLGYEVEKVFASHKGTKTGHYLPLVHLLISNLKRWYMGTHKGAIMPQHLQAYLNEFTFRFNRRFWRGPAFLRCLGLAVSAEDRPEYLTLYATKHGPEAGGWVHPNPRRVVSDAAVEAIVDDLEEAADDGLRDWIGEHRPEVREKVRRAAERSAG